MKLFVTILTVLISASAFCQSEASSFILDGDISAIEGKPSTIHCRYNLDGKAIEDSVKVINGKFRIRGRISEPVMLSLQVNYDEPAFKAHPDFSRDYAFVYLDKSRMQLTSNGKFSSVTVEGSAAHEEYINFITAEATYLQKTKALYKQLQELTGTNNESAKASKLKELEKSTAEMENELYIKFVRENPNSSIVFDVMNRLAGWKMDADRMQPLFDHISFTQKNTWAGKEFSNRLEAAVRTKIGAFAPAFQQPDTTGKMVSLVSFKGRMLLVDFWASWCLPCRQEHPFLLQAYRKYNDKGFEIISVSLDEKAQRDSWIKAINQDNISWTNVSELKGFASTIAKLYGVIAIPRNFLIDPQGMIIATDLRGKDLEKKLEQLLDKRS